MNMLRLFRKLFTRTIEAARTSLAITLSVLRDQRTAFFTLQFAYYGTVITSMAIAMFYPQLHHNAVQRADTQLDAYALGRYVKAAYDRDTGSFPLAAFLTFTVNLMFGTFLVITLPSLIIPFSGIALTIYRAVEWGLIFAPVKGEDVMIPHMVTLVLEAQPYILAALGSWIHGHDIVRQVQKRLQSWGERSKLVDGSRGPNAYGPVDSSRIGTSRRQDAAQPESTKFDYWRGLYPTVQLYPTITLLLLVSALWEAFEVIHLLPSADKGRV